MSSERCPGTAEVQLPALLRKGEVGVDVGRCDSAVVRIVMICEAHVKIGKLQTHKLP